MELRKSLQVLARLTPGSFRQFAKQFVLPESFIGWLYRQRASSFLAKTMEAQLWGGFAPHALDQLEALKLSWRSNRSQASHAALALARWYTAMGDCERALANVVTCRLADPSKKTDVERVLLEAGCMIGLGDRDGARALLTYMLERRPDDPNLCLAMANTYAPLARSSEMESDAIRLEWINRIYARANLVQIAKADSAAPLRLDNLIGPHSQLDIGSQLKVSVIMPSFNCKEFIRTSVSSILNQTWRNLELIIVDDFSTDGTREMLNTLVASDKRIKLLLLPNNNGPYVARNAGLQIATGDFVTCQDADDWSHPMRIEFQANALLNDSRFVANVSHWARATSNLVFKKRNLDKGFLHFNSSGIMIRACPVRSTLGHWDSVRFAADTEFWYRIRAAFGDDATHEIREPLAFALERPGSITQQEYTKYAGTKIGARRAYQDGYSLWHQRAKQSDGSFYMPFPLEKRLFGVPRQMLPGRRIKLDYDVVMISDFRHLGGNTASSIQEILAHCKAGIRTAVVQVDRHDFDVDRSIHPRLQALIDKGAVDILTHGERVSAKVAIVRFPAIFSELHTFLPQIDATHVLVVVNQPPRRIVGEPPFYSVERCRQHIEAYLGKGGTWLPIGPAVRRAFEADGMEYYLSDDYWFNIIDVDTWAVDRPSWLDSVPVIGRHGRDNFEKWPSDPQAVLAAYPTDGSMRVRILGGASVPSRILGATPRKWEIIPFNEVAPEEFLKSIDFFVYFPHEGRIEAFGRTIIEAMASGCLVILPETFRELFEDAAIYCDPVGVEPTVMQYFSDREAYEKQTRAARQFVIEKFSFQHHIERLQRLKAESNSLGSMGANQ